MIDQKKSSITKAERKILLGGIFLKNIENMHDF